MMRRRRPVRASSHGLDILTPAQGRAPGPMTEADAAGLLATPATDDDLAAALASRPPRAKLPSVTLALAVAAMTGAGFLGGVLLEKYRAGSGSGNSLAAAFASGGLPSLAGGGLPNLGGGGAAARATGAGGTAGFALGRGTIGTVKLVDGSTIYIQGFTGTITKVTTTPATKIQVSAPGTVKDLRPGQTLMIQGTKHGSGTVAATSVTESGLGGG